ncbi:MAG: aminotransferase [Zetaproteobacteria bacterium CG06_land_8_20_14_3_00_59_53]|nr:MAG: aminotransferase [Zetaproteobacteria bacterium CG2_30_59_37]PIO88998.1 MAG: aminotransferase [Zetaproteobacteria bacterium CG23_combo_of_CG06-09_8_20_14_all_59_86]PIQ64350.1 MAG: aminotransferase [Zetaproteobacteria bacterium CG11_big_fil_rev_8_21_14_0_20_59_439]PIU70302.1 MAG: aminotransferase [Zetaproteobacteria bacterium CG06_land_8_20_14_3_00_59_53]PIU97299.1 MAG: aminotransferase [Zetaproteobacteria bacterium CG03_land_8_20_14_0_80_59_51]PIY45028.1 MAG: aminotransferase [Zetaprote
MSERKAGFPGWPQFTPEEIGAVSAVLASGRVNYWTGDEGRLFEREFAEFTGMPHAIALSNGTVALELALHALGVGEGDEVIVPSRTFIATASSAVMRGARPVVVDIDPFSQNMDADCIEAAITPNTRAIIAVHLGGWPCDMDRIMEIAGRHGLFVIEDCAQAHGAEYRGRPVGSFGDAAAFSFCQDKIMTTGGEGGMLLLRDEAAWRKAWAFKDHGKDFDLVGRSDHPPGHRWLHTSFGTNFRMTEMQAAIGRIQLRLLPEWVSKRRAHALFFARELQDTPGLSVPLPPPHVHSSFYRLYTAIDLQQLHDDWNQDRIVEEINAAGVPCMHGSCSDISREKAFAGRGWQCSPHPGAETAGRTSLALLVHPTLQDSDIVEMARVIDKVMRRAVSR